MNQLASDALRDGHFMIVLHEIQPAWGIAMRLFRDLIYTHITQSLAILKLMSTCVGLYDT